MESPRASAPAPTDYAFLNHSASTLPRNLPPDVHNKPLARQKRKRTSPEDQAILEAAYQHDQKPDTEARRLLSQQVALGEKEVQIWFQNRRQSSRRKSRPLFPHEVAQYQASRSPYQTQSHFTVAGFEDSSPAQSTAATSRDHAVTSDSVPDPDLTKTEVVVDASDVPRSPTVRGSQKDLNELPVPESADDVVPSSQPDELNDREKVTASQTSQQSVQKPVQSIGYLSNRRNEALLRSGHDEQDVDDRPSQPLVTPNRPPMKKSRSVMRLSMTNEGNARIVQSSLSPSPPRRSNFSGRDPASDDGPSPTSFISRINQSTPTPKLLQRSTSGRSRDSRTWEFWCDKEARMELEEKAEKDGSGSAADAIGLMRSKSGRRVLGVLPGKRNAILDRSKGSAKRPKLDHQQERLQRSNTSSGMLQGRPAGVSGKAKPKSAVSAAPFYIPGNESDKENWSPSGAPLGGSHPDDLGEVTGSALKDARSLNRAKRRQASPRKRHVASLEDGESDAEVEAFMSADRRSSNATEEDDMDCVQGLLSLSQGNWK